MEKFVRNEIGLELYLVACINSEEEYTMRQKYLNEGFDACSEFSPGPQISHMQKITQQKEFVCDVFQGEIYDYKAFVEKKAYLSFPKDKVYRAVCPMWDNTARKKNKGMILDGATPSLYKQWLIDIIHETKNNKTIDDNFIFINAWNEWAEGAYLEPDLKWKYGYLEATKDAILACRQVTD